MYEDDEALEKKKSDPDQLKKQEEVLPLPSKSEILRREVHHSEKVVINREMTSGSHDPVIGEAIKNILNKGDHF